jgi:hypothetical protein
VYDCGLQNQGDRLDMGLWLHKAGAACVNKSKENAILTFFFIWTLWWANGGVGRTNDYASRYGWVVFGRYLLGWLTGMIVKWWLLFDASNTYIRIATIIFIWALQVVYVNKSNENAILSSDFVIWWCHVDCNICI